MNPAQPVSPLVPVFSQIMVCKGRLAHVRRSLPRLLGNPRLETILVDYGCPDGTAAVVENEFPTARTLRVDRADFNLSVARNSGAAAARGDWLLFLDADVIVADDFAARLAGAATDPGCFYRFGTYDKVGIFGSFVVRNTDFAAVGGYDDEMSGYGGADADLYFRLGLQGLRGVFLDADLVVEVLAHTDADRTRFYQRKSVTENRLVNATYRQIKNMLLRETRLPELPRPLRRELYRDVERRVTEALARSETEIGFVVPLGDDPAILPFDDWRFQRRIIVDLVARNTSG